MNKNLGGLNMSYFYYEDKKVYYKESGKGTPLLLLHGNTASSVMFYEIEKLFRKKYNVICIDFLGHGKSERLDIFPADLWFYEAQQVIAFLKEKQYGKVDIIGTSGGALVAINVALEAGEYVNKVIADSFEGERCIDAFTKNITQDRYLSKQDKDAVQFYQYMHGEDWEGIVDKDTAAIAEHALNIQNFFHKPLSNLQADILLVGSREDEFVCSLGSDYFDRVYREMLDKIQHGNMHLFEHGRHPAMLSNAQQFYEMSIAFLKGTDETSNL